MQLFRMAAIVVVCALQLTASFGQTGGMGGIWIGDRSPDPITDQFTTLATVYPQSMETGFTIRCQKKTVDLFIKVPTGSFAIGDKTKSVIRTGSAAPQTFDAISVQDGLLVVDYRSQPDFLPKLMTMEQMAVRYFYKDGRENTLVWKAALKPNMLANVGRALADCGIVEFPQKEIETSTNELTGKRRK